MLHFENDYTGGFHPALLEALTETNDTSQAGYGSDAYTSSAIEKIREACQSPEAQVTFLAGGTQTNQFAIASLLRPYEGVISAQTGHIASLEAGAIEHSGHKVLTLPQENGKLKAQVVSDYLEAFHATPAKAHMVQPGMVYISHPTEYGTLYTKAELEALAEVCRRYQLPLFLDGARLGYGLGVASSDLDLPTIAELCDAFYIGGTKLGAIAGEALVYTRVNRPEHFLAFIKQRGGLLAKGRLYGVQFDRFFTDDLYTAIGRQAVALADQIRQALTAKGYRLYMDSPSNLIFVIVPKKDLAKLAQTVGYTVWEAYDEDHQVIRLATSWSTTQEAVDALVAAL